jgi:hypothetical protein
MSVVLRMHSVTGKRLESRWPILNTLRRPQPHLPSCIHYSTLTSQLSGEVSAEPRRAVPRAWRHAVAPLGPCHGPAGSPMRCPCRTLSGIFSPLFARVAAYTVRRAVSYEAYGKCARQSTLAW